LKVLRTLADLDNEDEICEGHPAEALAYRGFDRSGHVPVIR